MCSRKKHLHRVCFGRGREEVEEGGGRSPVSSMWSISRGKGARGLFVRVGPKSIEKGTRRGGVRVLCLSGKKGGRRSRRLFLGLGEGPDVDATPSDTKSSYAE